MNNEQKKSNGKMIALYAVLAVALLITGFGATYAWLTWQSPAGGATNITPATFSCGMTDTGISGAAMAIGTTENPLTDTEGLQKSAYQFTVNNSSNIKVNYKVYMIKDSGDLTLSKLTLSLRKTTDDTATANQVATKALSSYTSDTTGVLLDSGSLTAGGSQKYFMRSWLNSTTVNSDSGKTYTGHLYVTCSQAVS